MGRDKLPNNYRQVHLRVMAIQPGDVVLAKTNGIMGRLIRLAERIYWRKGSTYSHAAIVINVTGSTVTVLQMRLRGCQRTTIDQVAPGGSYVTKSCPPGVDRARSIAYALTRQNDKYGIFTFISIAFNLLTPRWFWLDFRRTGTLICSALVARSWEHGGWNCPVDPFQISPAQIDMAVA